MGACLHAPLAALTAVLELTGNPNTILPGMAAVITAYLVARVAFHQEPLFLGILHARGVELRVHPVAFALERVGVASMMTRDPVIVDLAMRRSSPASIGAQREAVAPSGATAQAGMPRSAEWTVVVDANALLGVWPGARGSTSRRRSRAGWLNGRRAKLRQAARAQTKARRRLRRRPCIMGRASVWSRRNWTTCTVR